MFEKGSVAPGTTERVIMPVPKGLPIETYVVAGENDDGPTLLVASGVHGTEYVGPLAARKLIETLDHKKIKGRVIIIPMLNSWGFVKRLRAVMFEDGKNLNRVFPGAPNGSYSDRLAYEIENVLFPEINFLLDIHSGDVSEAMYPLVFYPSAAAPEITSAAVAASRCLSVPLRVPSKYKDGLFGYAADQGIPSLLLDRGGGGLWTEEEVDADVRDVMSLMAHLKMIPSSGPRNATQREMRRTRYVTAPGPGYWYPAVREGEQVKAYQKLGEFRSLEDRTPTAITALFDATVMYVTLSLGVDEDDSLIAYGT